MINNIKSKHIKQLLSFKNISKGLISIALITSMLVSPFSIHADTDTGESNEVGYINCKQFFTGYNMTQVETMGHGLVSNGTGGYNFTNQTVNTPSMWYNVMIMPAGLSFNRYTDYTSSNRTRATTAGSYIVFLSSTNFTDANTTVYTESGYTSQIHRITNDRLTISTPLGFYLICFKVTAINQHSRGYNWVTIDFEGKSSTQIVPLYMGTQSTMPEEIHRLVFGVSNTYETHDSSVVNAINTMNSEAWTREGRLEQQLTQINDNTADSKSYLYDIRQYTGTIQELLHNGNSSSQSTSNDLDNVSDSLADQVQNLNDVNQSLENDMSSSLNNLDTNSLLMQSQQFTKGMSWLKARFNTMFNNNPFGWYIQISLIIGIAIFMIGRYRK